MKFLKGQRVVKTMGCRMEGTVIPSFPLEDADDGTYRSPASHEKPVWVKWSDGTKGWIHSAHLAPADPICT